MGQEHSRYCVGARYHERECSFFPFIEYHGHYTPVVPGQATSVAIGQKFGAITALAQHGLTISDAKDEIFGLMITDYYKGPKRDFDISRPGDIWEFKKIIDGEKFYIKVKVVQENGEDILKILSFHEDDFA